MRAAWLLPLALAACVDENAGRDAQLLKTARAGMNAVRGLPGGMTASFTEVRLIGDTTVCGKIDGNDGDGPRPFSARGKDVAVADPRDPASVAAIERNCVGSPVYRLESRNAQFTDLAVAK